MVCVWTKGGLLLAPGWGQSLYLNTSVASASSPLCLIRCPPAPEGVHPPELAQFVSLSPQSSTHCSLYTPAFHRDFSQGHSKFKVVTSRIKPQDIDILLIYSSTPWYMLVCVHACMCMLSCVRLFATPCTVAHQAPLSIGFPRQEHWSGLPFPYPGYLPNSGIKPTSLATPALVQGLFATVLLNFSYKPYN